MTASLNAVAILFGLYTPVSQSVFEVCTYRDWAWGDGPYKLCFYNCESGGTKVTAVNSTRECPPTYKQKPNMRLNRN